MSLPDARRAGGNITASRNWHMPTDTAVDAIQLSPCRLYVSILRQFFEIKAKIIERYLPLPASAKRSIAVHMMVPRSN